MIYIMAIISWFTQPNTNRNDLHFASFYMYDTVNRDFVRIRLDLLRTHGKKKKKIMCKRNRIVLSMDDRENLEIIKNDTPQVGRKIYDFTIGHKNVHRGNRVIEDAYLPNGVTVDKLTIVALKYIGREEDIELVDKGSKESELSTEILKLIQ